jgi:uncharacterized membrane protein YcaP (DUF421 family)
MRLAGIGTVGEVAWAILEPEGRISFIRCDSEKDEGRADDTRAS